MLAWCVSVIIVGQHVTGCLTWPGFCPLANVSVQTCWAHRVIWIRCCFVITCPVRQCSSIASAGAGVKNNEGSRRSLSGLWSEALISSHGNAWVCMCVDVCFFRERQLCVMVHRCAWCILFDTTLTLQSVSRLSKVTHSFCYRTSSRSCCVVFCVKTPVTTGSLVFHTTSVQSISLFPNKASATIALFFSACSHKAETMNQQAVFCALW